MWKAALAASLLASASCYAMALYSAPTKPKPVTVAHSNLESVHASIEAAVTVPIASNTSDIPITQAVMILGAHQGNAFAGFTAINQTSGAVRVSISGYPATPAGPSISCTEAGCSAQAASIEQAQELLERIANRSMRVDVSVEAPDNYCHVEHHIIEPKPDMVASAEQK